MLVVTDGEDNASRESLEQAMRRLEEKNGPTIYTIGLLGEEHSKRARRALREMAEDTGGVAFFPKDLSEVQAITSQIAHDIRNQYTIQYKPEHAAKRRRLSHGEGGSQCQGLQEAAGPHPQRVLRRPAACSDNPTSRHQVDNIIQHGAHGANSGRISVSALTDRLRFTYA